MISRVLASLSWMLLFTVTPTHASGIPELSKISNALGSMSPMDAWPEHNDPTIFDPNYEYGFEKLMLRTEARISDAKMPWSDTWWPSRSGGIANRWQSGPEYPARFFGSYEEERFKILAMTAEELRLLSPAEKYDVAMGDYSYSLTRAVLASTTANAPFWWGICEGWAAAAMAHREPAENVVVNPDGIPIEFGSSDVKGILAQFYAWEGNKLSRQLGWRCDPGVGDCEDVHPASFHLTLVNRVGLMNVPLVADVDGNVHGDEDLPRRGYPKPHREYQYEVWNQPVFAYKTRQLEEADCSFGCEGAAPDTVKQFRMETLITFADDESPEWKPTLGTDGFFQETRRYEYWLEVDSLGNIVGGSWVTAERPDFLWIVPSAPFTSQFQGLKQIYRPVLQTMPYCVPQRYLDEAAGGGRPVYPTGPACVVLPEPEPTPEPEPEPEEPLPEPEPGPEGRGLIR
jgi:hypothetical protein